MSKKYEREDWAGNKYWEDKDGNREYEKEDWAGNKYREDTQGNRTYEDEKIVKQDGKTYRQDWKGDWKPDTDWKGDPKVETDWKGDPKIETDWKGDQKIETDWKGDPIVPPDTTSDSRSGGGSSGGSSSGAGGGGSSHTGSGWRGTERKSDNKSQVAGRESYSSYTGSSSSILSGFGTIIFIIVCIIIGLGLINYFSEEPKKSSYYPARQHIPTVNTPKKIIPTQPIIKVQRAAIAESINKSGNPIGINTVFYGNNKYMPDRRTSLAFFASYDGTQVKTSKFLLNFFKDGKRILGTNCSPKNITQLSNSYSCRMWGYNLPAGNYEAKLFLDNRQISKVNFTIRSRKDKEGTIKHQKQKETNIRTHSNKQKPKPNLSEADNKFNKYRNEANARLKKFKDEANQRLRTLK